LKPTEGSVIELEPKRLGVMVVDQLHSLPRFQSIEASEDKDMSFARRDRPQVDGGCGCSERGHGGVTFQCVDEMRSRANWRDERGEIGG
jgi:hypothetical protein